MRRSVLLSLAVVLCVVSLAPAVPAAEFSADVETYMSASPKPESTGRIFVKGKKYRMEMMEGGKVASVTISDMATGTFYMLDPAQKTYMEMQSMDQAAMAVMEQDMKNKAEIVEMGTEAVSGYSCTKTKYIYKDKNLGTGIYWISPKLGYPLKYEVVSKGGTTRGEYRNIKEGSQPDSLFSIPPGYTKFSIPGLPPGVKIPGLK